MSQTVDLRSGDKMPLVGLGTWKIPKDKATEIVYEAIKSGYRLIDCACDYGNEKEVGAGINQAIGEGIVTRKQLFITSKLWNTFHRPEHVEPAFLRTLSDLNLQYLDLYLIHFPISLQYVSPETRYPPEWIHDPTSPKPVMIQDHVPLLDTWKQMDKLRQKGITRNIGISNFSVALIRDLLNGTNSPPAVLQVELHPYLTQKKLVQFCALHNIKITAYSSFGGSSYVELGSASGEDILMEHQTITTIAKRHNKSPAQILLKWATQQNIAIIPKTLNAKRLSENSDVFGWELTEEDIKEINGLNRNQRFNDPGVYCQKYFGNFFPIFE